MVWKQNIYLIFILFIWNVTSVCAQLNAPERIFLDSIPIYPEFGFETDDGYIIGGEEESCHRATLWKLDKDFNRINKRPLRHQFYEISEVIDMKWQDSTLEVLTRQLQYEDAGGDDGVKWYALNADFEILDSLYIPGVEGFDGVMTDSFWVMKTWQGSLTWLNKENGQIVHKIPFSVGDNDLTFYGNDLLSWKNHDLFRVGSDFEVDTIRFPEPILDIATDSNHIYILTEDQIRKLTWETGMMITDSIPSPKGARSLLPSNSTLVVITDGNAIYFFNNELLQTSQVQLYNDSAHKEELHYIALGDGSILRLGVTQLITEVSQMLLHGQEYGMIHRFDQNYSEDNLERHNLALNDLTLIDPYYGSGGISVSFDTIYIITKNEESHLRWQVTNTGNSPVHSGVVATNILYSLNCYRRINSHLFSDALLPKEDTLSGDFKVFEISEFPHGWEARRFVYTAYPNGHYDADFSDNIRSLTLRYIISSTDEPSIPGTIEIWPNPTFGPIHISIAPDIVYQRAWLTDWQGRTVSTHGPIRSGETIHLPGNAPAGMYLLHLQSPHRSVVKRFLLVR